LGTQIEEVIQSDQETWSYGMKKIEKGLWDWGGKLVKIKGRGKGQ